MGGLQLTPVPRARAPRLAPDERRAQLLQCAIGVFARRGIAWARPTEVAEAAGVSESTVFVYFPTRDDLVQTVLDEVERFYMRNNERYLGDSATPVPATILGLGAAFSESVDSHPHHARIWLDWSNSVGDAIFSRYLNYQERVVQMVTSTVQRGQAEGSVADDVIPQDAARILYMSAQMVVQMKLTGKSPQDVLRFLISATRAVVGRSILSSDIPAQLLKRLGENAGRGALRRSK